MLIWVLERSDKSAQSACLDFLKERLAGRFSEGLELQWRILPASRLWGECVRLLKREEGFSSSEYPDLIEYPALWQESLTFLGLLADIQDVSGEPDRWQDLRGRFGIKDKELIFPWLTGMTLLYYRKDILKRLGRTPEDLEGYEGWLSTALAACEGMGGSFFRGVSMPLGFTPALQWILNFGGDFLDPLNLMPAFHQAEPVRAIEALLNALVYPRLTAAASGPGMALPGVEINPAGGFPAQSFCLLSTEIPQAIRSRDPRVSCLLPPRLGARIVVAEEWALGVTKRGIDQNSEALSLLLDSLLGDASIWLGSAGRLGLLPTAASLWEPFLDELGDPLVREVSLAAPSYLRWIPGSLLMAPAVRVFENTLSSLYIEAWRQGGMDRRQISAALAHAAAEYRLIASQYDISKISQSTVNTHVSS